MKPIITIFIIFLGLKLSAQEYCGAPPIASEAYQAKLNLVKDAKLRTQSNVLQSRTTNTDPKRYVAVKPHFYRNTDGTGGLTMTELNKGLGQLNSYFKGINVEFYISGVTPNYINDDVFMDGTYTQSQEINYHDTHGVTNALR